MEAGSHAPPAGVLVAHYGHQPELVDQDRKREPNSERQEQQLDLELQSVSMPGGTEHHSNAGEA
jgi:hypothetical protein